MHQGCGWSGGSLRCLFRFIGGFDNYKGWLLPIRFFVCRLIILVFCPNLRAQESIADLIHLFGAGVGVAEAAGLLALPLGKPLIGGAAVFLAAEVIIVW